MFFLTLSLNDLNNPADKSRAGLLFEKYNKFVYYSAMKILHNHSSAEDVVQKTFMRIFKNIHKIGDIDSAKTKSFIFIIARNEAYRELAGLGNVDLVSFEEYMVEEEADSSLGSDEIWQSYVNKYDRQKMMEAVNMLPEHYKNIISFKYSNGYSYKEISDILGITEKSVSVTLTRAKHKLIKIYNALNN